MITIVGLDVVMRSNVMVLDVVIELVLLMKLL